MAFQGPGSYKISKGFRGEKGYLTTEDYSSVVFTGGPFEEGISWSICPQEGAEEGVYQIMLPQIGDLFVIGYLEAIFDTDGNQPDSGTVRITTDADAVNVGWRIVKAKDCGFSISVAVPPSSYSTLPGTLYLVEEDRAISLKSQDTGPVHWNFEASNPKEPC